MIGNAVINEGTDKGTFDFYWTHALISDETAAGVNQNCNFTNGAQSNDLCDQANDDGVENLRDIDNYNIYAPNCQTEGLVTPSITPSISQENQTHQETLQFHPGFSSGGRHKILQDTYRSECCRPVD
ncbi:Serine carboxypeptidase II-3 [Triticum urartu]|uniref:Serine carboxypeptidase II-3 n=1 Tax=Triticum urartu TaxID=4572 RepID=M7ZZ52_TRIUA|nr:Serine carboxypeptidase II-3 [Triticum urartu]